jgi:hypothetical protein
MDINFQCPSGGRPGAQPQPPGGGGAGVRFGQLAALEQQTTAPGGHAAKLIVGAAQAAQGPRHSHGGYDASGEQVGLTPYQAHQNQGLGGCAPSPAAQASWQANTQGNFAHGGFGTPSGPAPPFHPNNAPPPVSRDAMGARWAFQPCYRGERVPHPGMGVQARTGLTHLSGGGGFDPHHGMSVATPSHQLLGGNGAYDTPLVGTPENIRVHGEIATAAFRLLPDPQAITFPGWAVAAAAAEAEAAAAEAAAAAATKSAAETAAAATAKRPQRARRSNCWPAGGGARQVRRVDRPIRRRLHLGRRSSGRRHP